METHPLDGIEDHPSGETPEDVAILYSWANLQGAKYRDFSANRREYRAQMRHRAAEQLRLMELRAQSEAEAAAAYAEAEAAAAHAEADAATAKLAASRSMHAANPNSYSSAGMTAVDIEEADEVEQVRQASLRSAAQQARKAASERLEAARRAEAAALADSIARREEREIAEAQASAVRQAAQYAEADSRSRQTREAHPEEAVPGRISDPYSPQIMPEGEYFELPGTPVADLAASRFRQQREFIEQSTGADLDAYRIPGGSSEFRQRGYRPDEPSGMHPAVTTNDHATPSTRESAPSMDFEPRRVPSDIPPLRPLKAERSSRDERNDHTAEDDLYPWENADQSWQRTDKRTAPPPPQNLKQPSKRDDEGVSQPVIPSIPYKVFRQTYAGIDSPLRAEVVSRIPYREDSIEDWPLRDPHASSAPDKSSQDDLAVAAPAIHLPIASPNEQARPSQLSRPHSLERPIDRAVEPQVGNLTSNPSASNRDESAGTGNAAQSRRLPRNDEPGFALFDVGPQTRTRSEASPAWLYPKHQASSSYRSQTPPQQPAVEPNETLEHSRERLAARWFALKGVFARNDADRTNERQVAKERVRKAPIVAVFSLAGGVGKTSLVATLGRALSSLGEKVLLTDTTSHGLLPFYFGASHLVSGVVRTFSPPVGSMDAPIHLVSYDVDREDEEAGGRERIVEDLLGNSQRANRVLMDLNVNCAWMVGRLAALKPTILVPLAADMNSVISIQAVEKSFSAVLDADGKPLQPVYLLNQFDASLPLHLDVREVLKQQLQDRLLPFVVRRAAGVSEALAEGMTIVDYDPDSTIAQDYFGVANWLRSASAPAAVGIRNLRWSEQ